MKSYHIYLSLSDLCGKIHHIFRLEELTLLNTTQGNLLFNAIPIKTPIAFFKGKDTYSPMRGKSEVIAVK